MVKLKKVNLAKVNSMKVTVVKVNRRIALEKFIPRKVFFSSSFFWPQGEVSLSTPRFYGIHSDSAYPQSFSTVRDAGFEPGTTASVVWSPHISHRLTIRKLTV